MKKLPAGIEENLHFLCVEVDSQLITLQHYFEQASPALARRVLDRAGYAENLKSRILSVTANRLVKGVKRNSDKLILRCIEFIATDLERVTDICRKSIQQSEMLTDEAVLIKKPLISMLDQTRRAVELVMPAINQRKADIAIEIGHINARMRLTN
jgi:Na+/phosphate symporter